MLNDHCGQTDTSNEYRQRVCDSVYERTEKMKKVGKHENGRK